MRERIWSGCSLRPVEVDWRIAALLRSLAALSPPTAIAVGVELGVLEVDVEGEDVGVAVDGQDLPLEQTVVVGGGAHASMPPLVSSAPSVKWGLSLLSYIDSAAPIAMCMSRYL